MDRGERFVLVAADGDVLVPSSTVREIRFKTLPGDIVVGEIPYVSLRALAPMVRFSIDRTEGALIVTAAPEMFEGERIELGRRRPPGAITVAQNSAFLNYDVGVGLDDHGFRSLDVFGEAGMRLGAHLGYTSFAYNRTGGDQSLVRLLSQVTTDDPGALRRVTVGDLVATSGPSGASGLFGGVSISTNFGLDPYFVRVPGLDLRGAIRTPSELEVYVNGILVRRERLPPGEFTLANLPVTTGQNAATLVLRDAFGREERLTTPLYYSSALLRPGLHEYSYAVGWQRQDFGVRSFAYTEPAFAGYHRFGLSPGFTPGFRAEATRHVANAGPTATFLVGGAGEITVSAAGSHRDAHAGYAASARYTYVGGGLSAFLGADFASRDYASIFTEPSQTQARFRGFAGGGLSFPALGSLSATFAFESRYDGTETRRTTLVYSRPLVHRLTLVALAGRTEERTSRHELFVGLTWALDGQRSASLASRVEDGRVTTTAAFEKSPPLGPGAGYRVAVEAEDDRRVGAEARLQYRGPLGIYKLDYFRSLSGQNNFDLHAAGGIGILGGRAYASRPINDAFALVETGGLAGVKVFASNQEVGTTNRKGELLVPGLISHYDNLLGIEAEDLPINYSIGETTRYASFPYRGGGRVAFNVARLQAFEGRLFLIERGARRPAEFATIEVAVAGRTLKSAVGTGGALYLENLPPGILPARLVTGELQCAFDLTVPRSDDLVVDLGDLTCEVR